MACRTARPLNADGADLVDGHLRRAVGQFDVGELRGRATTLIDRQPRERGVRGAQRIDGAEVGGALAVAVVQGREDVARVGEADLEVVDAPRHGRRAVAQQLALREPLRLLAPVLELLDLLQRLRVELPVVGRVVDDELGVRRARRSTTRRTPTRTSRTSGRVIEVVIGALRSETNGRRSRPSNHAGSVRSLVRETLMRWPSRIVIVGNWLRKRSRMRAEDCASPAPAPWRYRSLKLWSPPLRVLNCARPLIAPTASDAPNTCR